MQVPFYEEHYFLDYTISKRHFTVSISLALIYIVTRIFFQLSFFLLQRQTFDDLYESLNSFTKLRGACFVMDLYNTMLTIIDN